MDLLLRILGWVERRVSGVIAAALRASAAVLTRLLKRGEHRQWRREAAEAARSRASGARR